MTYPHTLRSRVDASIHDARQGMAVMLRITEADCAEAERLVGDEPVITATHEEAMMFLSQWMAPMFGSRPVGRGRRA